MQGKGSEDKKRKKNERRDIRKGTKVNCLRLVLNAVVWGTERTEEEKKIDPRIKEEIKRKEITKGEKGDTCIIFVWCCLLWPRGGKRGHRRIKE